MQRYAETPAAAARNAPQPGGGFRKPHPGPGGVVQRSAERPAAPTRHAPQPRGDGFESPPGPVWGGEGGWEGGLGFNLCGFLTDHLGVYFVVVCISFICLVV